MKGKKKRGNKKGGGKKGRKMIHFLKFVSHIIIINISPSLVLITIICLSAMADMHNLLYHSLLEALKHRRACTKTNARYHMYLKCVFNFCAL